MCMAYARRRDHNAPGEPWPRSGLRGVELAAPTACVFVEAWWVFWAGYKDVYNDIVVRYGEERGVSVRFQLLGLSPDGGG